MGKGSGSLAGVPGIWEENEENCGLGAGDSRGGSQGEWGWGQGREMGYKSTEVAGMTLLHELESRGREVRLGAALTGDKSDQPSSSTF